MYTVFSPSHGDERPATRKESRRHIEYRWCAGHGVQAPFTAARGERSWARLVASSHSMKAIVRETYGPPDVLHLQEVPLPTLRDGDVLVRIHAASANAGDWHL